MRIPQSYIQKCKVVGHTFQTIFIFVGLCITIAVFTKDGETGGATRFYLALVSRSALWRMERLETRDATLTGTVLSLPTRHHLPHHGAHVVAGSALRKRLRLPRCGRPVHHSVVCRLRCRGHVEQQRHQGGCAGPENPR
jgi:hypothetical protein